MSLNAGIFPSLDIPTLALDFTTLVLGEDGVTADLRQRRIGVYVDLLDQFLQQHETGWSAPRRLVVGHSFGGMLAMSWWLAHQGRGQARVDGMVLVSTSPGPLFDAVRLRIARLGGSDLRIPLSWVIPAWNSRVVTRMVKRAMSAGSLEASPVDFRALRAPTDLQLDFAGWRNTDWRAMRSYREALNRFDIRQRLGMIDVPVIVLHGDRDSLFRLDGARDLAAGLPRGELRVVRGAAHGLPLTHGAAINDAVHDLLERTA